MHLQNKSQPFLFLYLNKYPFLIDLRCFLLFLSVSYDLQAASLNQDLSGFKPLTCVTCLDKPK